ncbi:hypothetical protein CKAN_02455500 [Cinnamomum micranthum f. kanehirae]|uniref:Uncharacterized protein n=1 Tax=Cinnamomum micranthum f. kanehirae TaxID=337451 RepID=A0A3S3P7I0_9MAGN|nr:hypothetical protein CKAN_02455500 [Cinnamomum micranthum f. kanehirae]
MPSITKPPVLGFQMAINPFLEIHSNKQREGDYANKQTAHAHATRKNGYYASSHLSWLETLFLLQDFLDQLRRREIMPVWDDPDGITEWGEELKEEGKREQGAKGNERGREGRREGGERNGERDREGRRLAREREGEKRDRRRHAGEREKSFLAGRGLGFMFGESESKELVSTGRGKRVLNGCTLPFPCQRSLFTLSTAMLIFVARSYQIPELNDFLKSHTSMDVDPYLSIGDDSQVYVKPQADEREYGSVDEEAAVSSLAELRTIVGETDKDLEGIIVQNLCAMTELDVDDLVKEMSETFTLDDTFLFSPPTMLGLDHIRAIGPPRKLLSFDEDFSASLSIDDDVSELSVVHPPHFIPTIPASPSLPHMISVTQLLESALEVAGQVAGASVSNSPRSYSTMASQCEALGTGTRNKLSSWLSHDLKSDKLLLTFPANGQSVVNKEDDEEPKQDGLSSKPWMALRLPPASPFDNFLKAAGC